MRKFFLILFVLIVLGQHSYADDIDNNFFDKVIVITGTSSGLGKSLAEVAAQKKMKVVMADINYAPSEELAKKIVSSGGDAVAIQVDLAKEEERGKIIDLAMEKYGRIDYLINNAGYIYAEKVEDLDIEQSHHLFEVNFWAYLDLAIRVIPIMKKQGHGAIINIASVGSFRISKDLNIGIYFASKHALYGLFKTMAMELDDNIVLKIVCPAGMKTNIFKNAIGSQKEKLMDIVNPFLKDLDSPDQIAKEIFDNLYSEDLILLPGKAKKFIDFIK